MEINKLKTRKALNKAFLKVKPNRTEIEGFKANLIQLLDRKNDTKSEEFHKNLVIDFLKKTYYDPNHFINTKERNDLVIHNGDNAKSTVGVIIEAKKPTNKSEMVMTDKLNAKAFQELVLYYLRERITHIAKPLLPKLNPKLVKECVFPNAERKRNKKTGQNNVYSAWLPSATAPHTEH